MNLAHRSLGAHCRRTWRTGQRPGAPPARRSRMAPGQGERGERGPGQGAARARGARDPRLVCSGRDLRGPGCAGALHGVRGAWTASGHIISTNSNVKMLCF